MKHPLVRILGVLVLAAAVVSQMVKLGDQPVQFFAGARYYLEKPGSGPEWGLRLGVTFLLPKG